MTAMNDFKPTISPGYTGNRHDDPPVTLTGGQCGILGFVAGTMFMMIITLLFRGLGA